MARRLVVVVALTLLMTAPAPALGARGVYKGRTAQGLPLTMYVEQARRGELGRQVVYTGMKGDHPLGARELATLAVRVTCTSPGRTRWSELVRFRLLGPPRGRTFSEGGSYTIRKGRFRYAPLDLGGRGDESLDERFKGRLNGARASGVLELRLKKFAADPIAEGMTIARCRSGRVRWRATRRGRGGRGIPHVGGFAVPPRGVREDALLTRLLGQSIAIFKNEGGGSFTGYAFQAGGAVAYCHKAGEARDYRSGDWSLLSGTVWWGRPLVEGAVRLTLGGAVVDATVAFHENRASASAPGLVPITDGELRYGEDCLGLEQEVGPEY